MRVTILCVGRIKEEYFTSAVNEYSKRLTKFAKLEIIEVKDEKTPDKASASIETIIKKKEGERLIRHIKEDAYVVVLDAKGKKLDSVELADTLNMVAVSGKSHLTFIIGGSIGLANKVIERADLVLSFSDMIFPHQLMRVILLEQIYRAYKINNNEPYHK